MRRIESRSVRSHQLGMVSDAWLDLYLFYAEHRPFYTSITWSFDA